MKQRVVVMNGQKVVQGDKSGAGGWSTLLTEKAGSLRPGIYNIYMADQVDKSRAYMGAIVHADADHIYQQVGRSYVRHQRADFEKGCPAVGDVIAVRYDNAEVAISEQAVLAKGRKI